MKTMDVMDPTSGKTLTLWVKHIINAPYPGWVVLIPGGRNIWLHYAGNEWRIKPEAISKAFALAIVQKITKEPIPDFNI